MAEKTNWPLIVLLWAAGLGAAGQYAKISVIFAELPGIYPDAGASLGFAVSLVGFLGIVLGVAAGVLVARVGYRRALLAALLVGATMSVFQSGFPALPLFLASRAVEGAAHLAIVVAAPTLIADLVTDRDRGLALTLWGTFFGVAFAVLAWLAPVVLASTGPGALLAGHGVYMLIMAVILWGRVPVLVHQSERVHLAELISAHARIYASPRIGAAALGWLFYTTCFVSVLTVFPPYLPDGSRAFVSGAMPLMSILSSLTLGVFLLRLVGATAVIVAGFLLCAISAAGLIGLHGSPWLAVVLGAGLGLVQGASFALVPELNAAPGDRALANGGLAQMGNLGNTSGTPIMVAVIAGAGYGGLMSVLAALFLAGAAVHLVLARRRAVELSTGNIG